MLPAPCMICGYCLALPRPPPRPSQFPSPLLFFPWQMRPGHLSEAHIAAILRELLRGLDYLHTCANTAHRNVKGAPATGGREGGEGRQSVRAAWPRRLVSLAFRWILGEDWSCYIRDRAIEGPGTRTIAGTSGTGCTTQRWLSRRMRGSHALSSFPLSPFPKSIRARAAEVSGAWAVVARNSDTGTTHSKSPLPPLPSPCPPLPPSHRARPASNVLLSPTGAVKVADCLASALAKRRAAAPEAPLWSLPPPLSPTPSPTRRPPSPPCYPSTSYPCHPPSFPTEGQPRERVRARLGCRCRGRVMQSNSRGRIVWVEACPDRTLRGRKVGRCGQGPEEASSSTSRQAAWLCVRGVGWDGAGGLQDSTRGTRRCARRRKEGRPAVLPTVR